jgi:hypothetical protein
MARKQLLSSASGRPPAKIKINSQMNVKTNKKRLSEDKFMEIDG